MNKQKNCFVCFFWFCGWEQISFGINISLAPFNIEFHIPFGFIRIGFEYKVERMSANYHEVKWRQKGYGQFNKVKEFGLDRI